MDSQAKRVNVWDAVLLADGTNVVLSQQLSNSERPIVKLYEDALTISAILWS